MTDAAAQITMPWAPPPSEEPRPRSAPPAPAPATLYTGTVVDLRFPRRETGVYGFRVIAVELDGVTSGLGSPRNPMPFVGEMAPVKVGARIQATGTIEQDRKRGGEQLKVTSCGPHVEASTAGILAYLAGGAIPHVRGKMAAAIVKKFGDQTLAILDHAPERLAEVPGIKPDSPRLAKMIAAWTEGRSKFVAMQWFAGHGVSTYLAKRIVDEYGPRALAVVESNPYQLAADVDGIGFDRADEIARKLGMPADSPLRACAALLHALGEAASKGHCYLPEHEMVTAAAKLIERPEAALREALALLTKGDAETIPGTLGGNVVSLGRLADAERRVAKRVKQLLEARPSSAKLAGLTRHDAERAAAAFEAKSGMKLAPVQRDAVLLAATAPMMVITGGPGVGKTTVLRALLAFFETAGCAVTLMSPTGKAAKRMAEVTGHEAKTIHSTLGAKPNSRRFLYGLENPLPADVVVIDESSMCDIALAAAVFEAVALGRRLILVGDVDQLPSVAPGAVLHDLIASGVVPTVRLTQVYRQAKGSSILTAAHAINAGVTPTSDEGPAGDFYVRPKPGSPFEQSDAADLVVELATVAIPERRGIPFHDILVLTPMHKGEAGTIALNDRLKAVLNPPAANKREMQRGDRSFREGDRVMQKKNDPERGVMNGDVGTVSVIREPTEDDKAVMVVLFDGREVAYESKDVSHLQLAYAISIHKSQGNEAPAVIVVMHKAHWMMLSRNLVYTAVTRGKRLVMLLSDAATIRKALSETRRERRNTLLAERLRGEVG